MKVRVELSAYHAHVEALDSRGDLLGELTANPIDPESIFAQGLEVDELAETYTGHGDVEGARYAEAASRILFQCLAVYHDMVEKADRNLALWTITTADVTQGAPPNTMAAMFRAIVKSLGKRDVVVWAGKCTEYFGIAEEQPFAGEAWKTPAFRQGLWLRGPVAFAPSATPAALAPEPRSPARRRARQKGSLISR